MKFVGRDCTPIDSEGTDTPLPSQRDSSCLCAQCWQHFYQYQVLRRHPSYIAKSSLASSLFLFRASNTVHSSFIAPSTSPPPRGDAPAALFFKRKSSADHNLHRYNSYESKSGYRRMERNGRTSTHTTRHTSHRASRTEQCRTKCAGALAHAMAYLEQQRRVYCGSLSPAPTMTLGRMLRRMSISSFS